MADEATAPDTLKAIEQAAQRAERAAAKAQKAAAPPKYWLLVGIAFAFVGAVLAFALKDSDPSLLGVRLQPLGGVLFAVGVLLMAGVAVSSALGGEHGDGVDASGLKSIGGLIAVVTGVVAVTSLAIVSLTQLGNSKDSIVAVTSSAFGIISAVVGAYLGIKVTADSSTKATQEAKNAAVAEHVAEVANRKFEGAIAEADKNLDPDEVQMLKNAGSDAAAEAARKTDPPPGGDRP